MTISNILCYDTDLTPEVTYANKSADIGAFFDNPVSVRFNNDGTKLFVLSQGDKTIHQCSLDPAYDISSITLDNITLFVGRSDASLVGGFDFLDNGSLLYVSEGPEIGRYSLSTPYDISTAVFEFVAISSDKNIKSLYRQHNNDSNIFAQLDYGEGYRIVKYDVEAGFNLSDTDEVGLNFLVFTSPKSAEFSPDGTKVFVINNEKLSQYTLTTPYDLSTAGDSVDLFLSQFSCNTTDVEQITLSADGTKMYMLEAGTIDRTIYQFDLSTPYDILSIGTKEAYLQGSPENLFFNNSGSKMYTIDLATTTIHQFSLGTNFDPSSATYDSKSFDFSNQDSTVRSVNFNANGTKMYLLGSQTAKIYSYTLNPAYDISTAVYTEILPNSVSEASYDSVSLNITSQSPNPKNKKFNSNGTKLYILDFADRVDQYGLGTAYDLTTATYEKTFTFDNLLDPAESIAINDNGTKFYILTNRSVHQFSLTTPYDITTAVSSTFIFDEISNAGAVRIENNGTKLYALDSVSGQLYQYSLASANDPSTLSYDGISFDFSNQATAQGFDFKPDGTKMFMVANERIYQYSLGSAFNIGTASYDKIPVPGLAEAEFDAGNSFDASPQIDQFADLTNASFNNNGSKLYVIDDDAKIYQYSLSTAYDVSSATYDNKSLDINTAHVAIVSEANPSLRPYDILFNNTGSKLYVLDDRFLQILDFDLGTPYDISTASLNQTMQDKRILATTRANQEYFPNDLEIIHGIRWIDNGNKIAIGRRPNGSFGNWYISVYAASTPYDLGTVSLSSALSQTNNLYELAPQSFDFNSNGTKLFVESPENIDTGGLGFVVGNVKEYNLGSAYNLSGVSDSNFNKEAQIPLVVGRGTAIRFNNNGTKLYALSNSSTSFYDRNYIVEMDLNSAYDINSLRTKTMTMIPGLGNLRFASYNDGDVTFNSNGSLVFVLMGNTIYQYRLTTPYDLQTAEYEYRESLEIFQNTFYDFRAIRFNNNGTKLYALEEDKLRVYEYDVPAGDNFGIAFGISSTGRDFYHGLNDPTAMCFGDSGTKLFIADDSSNQIRQYNLSTAYDATTAGSPVTSFTSSAAVGATSGMDISNDGTQLTLTYTSLSSGAFIRVTMSTPFNLSTASYESITTSPPNHYWGFKWHPNGNSFITFDRALDVVVEFTVSTSFDVRTATWLPYVKTTEGAQFEYDAVDFDFNSTGDRLYLYGATVGVKEYELTTPFDLSSASPTDLDYDAQDHQYTNPGVSWGFAWRDNDSGFTWISQTASGSTAVGYDGFIPAGYVDRVQYPFDISDTLRSFSFSDNGNKLLIGREETGIKQYSLSTPYVINELDSTTNYDNKTFNPGVNIEHIYSTPDGSYLYVLGSSGLQQFSVSSSNDISTASNDNVTITINNAESIDVDDNNTTLIVGFGSGIIQTYDLRGAFYIGNQMSSPVGIKFTNSGTEAMVLSSASDTVYQYNLSSGFDLSAVSYASKSRSISSSFASDITLNDTGTKMFVTCTDGATGDSFSGEVIQYNLPTANSLSGATEGSSLGIGLDSSSVSVDFSNNGTRMFLLGNQHNVLLQYDLDDPYDIFPSKVTSDVFFIGQNSNLLLVKPDSIQLTSDGTRMYLGDTTRNAINYYLLDTAFNTATAIPSLSQSVDLDNLALTSGVTLNPIDFVINSAGDRLYVLDNLSNSVHQFTVPSIFNLSSAQYDFISASVNSEESSPTSLAFNSNFSKMYVTGLGSDRIFQYSLNGALFVGGKDNSPIGMEFLDSGTKLYVAGNETDKVHQFTLGTGFDLSTLNDYLISSPGLSGSDSNIRSFTMNSAGTQAYFAGDATDRIYQYDLGTAYNISTASASKEIQVNFNNTTDISGVNLSGSGNSLIVSSEGNYQVYPLETNFDISSTKIHSTELEILLGESNPTSIRLSETGDKLWLLGDSTNKLYEYDLSVNNDLSTAVYNNVSGNPMVGENIDFDSFQFNRTGSKVYLFDESVHTWFQASTNSPFSVDATSDNIEYVEPFSPKGSSNFSFDSTFTRMIVPHETQNRVSVFNLSFTPIASTFPTTLSSENGFAVSSSGTNLYMPSENLNSVGSHRLATPFALTSKPPFSEELDVESTIEEIEVNNDRTKLYVLSQEELYEYDISPTLQILTPVNDTPVIRDISVPIESFKDAVFNNDGTKMFVIQDDLNGTVISTVFEYTLSTAYDITTAEYSGVNYHPDADISATITEISLEFNSDGTKMFLLGTNDRIYQFDLGTGFDLSTVTYNNKLFNLTSQTTSANSICLNTTGSKLFVGASAGKIYEYDFGNNAPDLADVTYNIDYDLPGIPNSTYFEFNTAGTELYALDNALTNRLPKLYRYPLSSPFTLSTAQLQGVVSVPVDEDNSGLYNADALLFNNADDTVYVSDKTYLIPAQIQSTRDFSSLYYDGTERRLEGEAEQPEQIQFNNDGTKMYVLGLTNIPFSSSVYSIYQYSLSNAYDLSTAQYDLKFFEISFSDYFSSFAFNGDGTKVFIVGRNTKLVYQYSLSVAFDISTAVYDNSSFPVSVSTHSPRGITFNNDGSKMYIGFNVSSVEVPDLVYQYSLTNYSLSTASYDGKNAELETIVGIDQIQFNNDGTKLFASEGTGTDLALYYLDTPFDVSTMLQTMKLIDIEDLTNQINSCGLAFNDNGTKMYTVDRISNEIFELDLERSFDFSGAFSVGASNFNAPTLQQDDRYGHSVDVSGDLYIVGAPGENAAYIYLHPNTLQQKLQPSDAVVGRFGYSVSIDGNIAIVGSPDANAAYVFTTSDGGATWTEQQKLVGSNTISGDGFGWAVSISGDDIIIGSPFVDGASGGFGRTNMGGAYIFTTSNSGATWTEQAILSANDLDNDDNFGRSVAITDSYAVVGSFRGGVAYTFEKTLSSWSQIQKLIRTSGSGTSRTWSVAISGDTILVGDEDDNEKGNKAGAVFVYSATGSIGNVTEFQKITAPDGFDFHEFGASVAIDGENAIIGAPRNANAVYWIVKDNVLGYWSIPEKVNDPNGNGREFGFSVGLSGDRAIVGDPENQSQATDAGAAYRVLKQQVSSDVIFNDVSYRTFFEFMDNKKVLFNADASKMFAANSSIGEIHEFVLTTPGDVNTAVSSNKSLNFSPGGIRSMSFNDNGSKIIAISISPSRLYEIVLLTPYDLSTASETGLFFDYNQGSNPTAVLFNNTGTKMFILDGTTDTIFQYSLSNGYDLSTALYDGDDLSIDLAALGFSEVAADIEFNSTGTELYYFDKNSELIYRFALNPAYDITTMTEIGIPYGRTEDTNLPEGLTFVNNSFYVADGVSVNQYKLPEWSLNFNNEVYLFTGESNFDAITFKPDGTKMYIADKYSGRNWIYAYELSTPFEISSARFIGEKYKVNNSSSAFYGQDLEFNGDGTKLFLLETNINLENQIYYAFTLTVPYDISTISFVSSRSYNMGTRFQDNFTFNNDGTKFYLGAYQPDLLVDYQIEIWQFDLTTPYDDNPRASSAYVKTLNITGLAQPNSLAFNKDGTRLYIAWSNRVFQFPLSTPFELSTLREDLYTVTYSPNQKIINDIYVEPELGRIFYGVYINSNNDVIYQQDYLKDGSAITFNNTRFEFFDGFISSKGFRLDSTGKHLFAIDEVNSNVDQFDLGTAYDISTLITTDKTFDVSSQETVPTSLEFDPSGSLMFVVGTASNQVHQYALSSANDISTATFVTSFDLSLVTTNPAPFGIQFNDTGSLMFILNNDTLDQQVYAYTLSVPYQIQTAVLSKILNYSDLRVDQFGTPLGINATSMLMNAVGNRLYLVDSTDLKFYQYVLSVPFDLSSAEYNNEVIDIPSEVTQTTRNKFFDIDFSRKIIYFSEGRGIYQYSLAEGAFAIRPMTPAEINNLAYDVLEHLATQNQQTGNLEVTDDAGVTNTLLDTFEDTDFDPVTEQAVIESSTPFYFVDQEEYTALPSTPPDLLEYSVNGSEVSLQPSSTGRSLFEDIADIAIELMLGAGTSSPGPNTYKLVEFNESPGPGTWETVADIGDTFRIGSDPTEDISNVDFNSDGTDFVGIVQVGNFVDVDDPNSGSGTKHTMWIDQNILVSVQEITNFQDSHIGVTVRTYDINLITNTLTLIDTAVVDSQSVPVGASGASYEVDDSLYFENTEVEFVVSVAVRAYGLNERHGYIKFNIDSSGNITNNSGPTYAPAFNSPYHSLKTASAEGVQEFANGSKQHVWKAELYDYADTSSIYLVFNEGDTGGPDFSTSDPFFQNQEFFSRRNWTWDLNNITSYTAQQITNTLDQTQNNYKLLRKVAQEDKGTYPQPVKLENDTITLYASADINAIAQYIRQRIHETKKGTYDITTDGNPPDVINTWENMGSITDTRNSSTGSLTLLSTTVDVETLTLWRRTD